MSVAIRIGGESFRTIREGNYYYADKTSFIEELFAGSQADVSLITRPRRFGKTLLMNMLYEFFSAEKESSNIFDGLAISKNTELCAAWMNAYPTIFLSLKEFYGKTFQEAIAKFANYLSGYLIQNFTFLLNSPSVEDEDKHSIRLLRSENAGTLQVAAALSLLMRCLYMHYTKKVIVLIDEYDVPLAKAYENSYYDEMVDFIRTMFGSALKTNSNLNFSIVTGCLRIAKESIFTGLNSFECYGIEECDFTDKFGFSESEVETLLAEANMEDKKLTIQEWYDGYIFGDGQKMYCPWDVLLYVKSLQKSSKAKPKNYWSNTSGNSILVDFLDKTNFTIKDKIEKLINGGWITAEINEALTYDELYTSEDNFWTLLYLTGYVTKLPEEKIAEYELGTDDEKTYLVIPNQELHNLFVMSVQKLFLNTMVQYNRKKMFDAFWDGNTDIFCDELQHALRNSISYYDYQENFYHAFVTGIFYGSGYTAISNREGGTGRMDICILDERSSQAAVIEIKHTRERNTLQKIADAALAQIDHNDYDSRLYDYRHLIRWGIGFCKKSCSVCCRTLK